MAGVQCINTERECGLCQIKADNLKLCGQCRCAWYCSPDHQRQHWREHKIFCKSQVVYSKQASVSSKTKKSIHSSYPYNFNIDPSNLIKNESVSYNRFQQLQNGEEAASQQNQFQVFENDLITPIESSTSQTSLASSRPKPQALFSVEVCQDSQHLEEGGFSSEWFTRVTDLVISHLNDFGVCVVDNFFGIERAERILCEVKEMHHGGMFHDGQVVSKQVQDQDRTRIRGDKITWVTGNEPERSNIGQLISVVDTLVSKANRRCDAGKLADYNITLRTRAMVACYPGRGTHYVKHVDNPNSDGRCITAIYYINQAWVPENGGVLRIYPEGCSQVANIEPLFDRMLFFWSDRRNPHEVLPSSSTSRYAITVWYLDSQQREEYLSECRNPQLKP